MNLFRNKRNSHEHAMHAVNGDPTWIKTMGVLAVDSEKTQQRNAHNQAVREGKVIELPGASSTSPELSTPPFDFRNVRILENNVEIRTVGPQFYDQDSDVS